MQDVDAHKLLGSNCRLWWVPQCHVQHQRQSNVNPCHLNFLHADCGQSYFLFRWVANCPTHCHPSPVCNSPSWLDDLLVHTRWSTADLNIPAEQQALTCPGKARPWCLNNRPWDIPSLKTDECSLRSSFLLSAICVKVVTSSWQFNHVALAQQRLQKW